jgi:hypothetical protein
MQPLRLRGERLGAQAGVTLARQRPVLARKLFAREDFVLLGQELIERRARVQLGSLLASVRRGGQTRASAVQVNID